MKLSIIIVAYKCKEQLEVTLDAVFASQVDFNYEVIVLDNNSVDGTVELINQKYLSNPIVTPYLTFIENQENLGFPVANNMGLKQTSGQFVLFLNPDTKVDKNNLQTMVAFMEGRPEVGIATCKLIKPDGSLDPASRRGEPSPKTAFYRLSGLQTIFPKKFGSYNLLNADLQQESVLDACSGAYMMVSRKCLEAVGGFDERFYMYGEDLDLCRRGREAGFKVWYYPATGCVHYKGQSSKKAPTKSLYAFHHAMWLYYDKWYRHQTGIIADIIIYLAIWARFYLKVFINAFRKDKYVSK